MTAPPKRSDLQRLPTHFGAVSIACDCFGIRMPQLAATLKRIRVEDAKSAKANKDLRRQLIKDGTIPTRPFPKKLHRPMLINARRKVHKQEDGLCTVAYHALREVIRFNGRSPKSVAFGAAATLSEHLALDFPRLYSEIRPHLLIDRAHEVDVVKILVENVFVPTLFLELKKQRRSGFADELSAKECWYLPRNKRGEHEYPFKRVLKAWLNAAGCRGPEDVGKQMQADKKRKNISNWLKAKNTPYKTEIGKMVDSFRDETDRFDDAEAWKARLLLAAAMQRLCSRLDGYFSKCSPNFSFELLELLKGIESNPMPIDCDCVLEQNKTYFAARLVWRRVSGSTEWMTKIAKLEKTKPSRIPDSATWQEVDEIRERFLSSKNSGNLLLAHIQEEVDALQKAKNEVMVKAKTLHDQIFALGVVELIREIGEGGRQNNLSAL